MKKCAHNLNTNITLSTPHPTQGGQTSYHFMQETVRSNAIPTAYIVNSKKQVVWMGHAMRVGPALEATLVEDTPFCTSCLGLSNAVSQNVYRCRVCGVDVCVQCARKCHQAVGHEVMTGSGLVTFPH